MCELFGRDRSVITKHIRNIFEEEELDENSKVQNMHIEISDKPVKSYLDVIFSVGHRVKLQQSMQCHIGVNQPLTELTNPLTYQLNNLQNSSTYPVS